MKNRFAIIVGIVLLVLAAYSVVYQVRFDEVAVVTRFGAAGEGAVINATDDDQSGLRFKWPRPIEAVRTYDKRVQVLEDRPEEQQTLDNVSVVLQTYLAWRISDPLAFSRSLITVENAEKILREELRGARKIVGARYTFADMANSDPQQLKLDQLERDILERLRANLAVAEGRVNSSYGVELESVGIKRVLLAPKTTEEVFNRMKSTRQRMAEGYRKAGEARATQIKADAEGMKTTILTFAESRAKHIRSEGEEAASKYLEVFGKDPEFAIDLQKIDALREMFRDSAKGKTTILLDAGHPLFQWFQSPPAGPGDTRPVPASKDSPEPVAKKE
jgi:modulator of FtsH protease HflC